MNMYPRKKIHEKSLKHDASYSVIANVSDDQDQEEEDGIIEDEDEIEGDFEEDDGDDDAYGEADDDDEHDDDDDDYDYDDDYRPMKKRQKRSSGLAVSFDLPRSKTDPVTGVYHPPQLDAEQLLRLPEKARKRAMDPIPSFEESRQIRIAIGGKSTKCVDQICLLTGKILRRYISGTDAAVAMQVSQSPISLCCRGIKPDAYGFNWRICDDPAKSNEPYDETPIEELLDMRVMKRNNQYTQNPSETRLRLKKLEKREETLLRRALNKQKVRQQKRVERDMARKDKQSNKQKPKGQEEE